jgi:hypothetical protein
MNRENDNHLFFFILQLRNSTKTWDVLKVMTVYIYYFLKRLLQGLQTRALALQNGPNNNQNRSNPAGYNEIYMILFPGSCFLIRL